MSGELQPPGEEPPAAAPPAAATTAGSGGAADPGADARPHPSELDPTGHRRAGPPARARQAASVIVVRRAGGGELELLLVKRNPLARFMGGVWVFPGGAVDSEDGEGDRAHRAAAVRELAEEAGIERVDPAGLVKFSRWITPAEMDVRFDTHFFIAPLPGDGQEPRIDGRECVALEWLTAQAALDAHAAGRILLVLPTIRQLEQLRGFTSVEALIEHARTRRPPVFRPRVVLTGEAAGIVTPGEPGYDGD